MCLRERERERERENLITLSKLRSLTYMHTALGVFIAGVLISLLLIIPLVVRKRRLGMYIHSA